MNTSVLNQAPQGEDLTRAVFELEEHGLARHVNPLSPNIPLSLDKGLE